MMAFNRDRNSSRSGGDRGEFRPKPSFGNRPRFGDSDRGPVEIHKTICDNCGNECEVPFKPTQGKPVFCRTCFEKNRSSEPRRESQSQSWNPRRSNSEDREMFDAVCDTCGKDCKIPFRPTGDRPIYCSNCFEKGNNAQPQNREQSNYNQQFESLNTKLDSILRMLESAVSEESAEENLAVEETVNKPVEEQIIPKAEKKKRASKKANPST